MRTRSPRGVTIGASLAVLRSASEDGRSVRRGSVARDDRCVPEKAQPPMLEAKGKMPDRVEGNRCGPEKVAAHLAGKCSATATVAAGAAIERGNAEARCGLRRRCVGPRGNVVVGPRDPLPQCSDHDQRENKSPAHEPSIAPREAVGGVFRVPKRLPEAPRPEPCREPLAPSACANGRE